MKYFTFRKIAVLSIGMALVACGADKKMFGEDTVARGGTSGSRGGTAGVASVRPGGNGNAHGIGGADSAAMGPVVAITSPVAVADPNTGPVIADVDTMNHTVDVVCNVKKAEDPGASPVDPTKVALEVLDPMGNSLQTFPAMQSPDNAAEYSAHFVFTNVPNGKVFFRCTAKDIAGETGTDVISTFVDHGPSISSTSPTTGSPHTLGSLEVEFTVDEAPLSPDDQKAKVDSVTLAINGVTLDLTGTEDSPLPGEQHYKLHVNLSDSKLFPTRLNGSVALSITATNERKVTYTDTYHFVVDSEGPKITISAPMDGDIIGGNHQLEFTVQDAGAGVNKDSVVVIVNKDTHVFDKKGLWTEKMGAYTFSLDSAGITGATVQINVEIRADDLAGNPADGATATYYLDTMAPVVDMDPPKFQEVKRGDPSNFCSLPFDPLGSAVNDLQTIAEFATIRAIAWDMTNGTPDQQTRHFAGLDPTSVKLYVQGSPDDGLLIDQDGDGVCDEVDTTLPLKDLHPVSPQGSADYAPTAMGIANDVCIPAPDPTTATPLCGGTSDLKRVIQHDQVGGPLEAVVYAIPTMGGECNSTELQVPSIMGVTTNGWVCLAVRAVDKAGNVGISAPSRVCLSDPTLGAAPACVASMAKPPSCTRKCRPPQHFSPNSATQPYVRMP